MVHNSINILNSNVNSAIRLELFAIASTAREEKERTMRHEKDEKDAKSRERRGGTAMGEPHARGRQEERAAAQDAREFGTRGACGGDDYASIRNIVKNIIQCQDFPLTC